MLIGVSCRAFEWRDVEEAVARVADEFGVELLEFDAARLAPKAFPQLGLLGQRYGLSFSLRVSPWPGDPEGLDTLRERCEEGLIQYLILDPGDRPEPFARAATALAQVAPGYESSGLVLCVECDASWIGNQGSRPAERTGLPTAVARCRSRQSAAGALPAPRRPRHRSERAGDQPIWSDEAGSATLGLCLRVAGGQQVSGIHLPEAVARYLRVVDPSPLSPLPEAERGGPNVPIGDSPSPLRREGTHPATGPTGRAPSRASDQWRRGCPPYATGPRGWGRGRGEGFTAAFRGPIVLAPAEPVDPADLKRWVQDLSIRACP